MIQNVSKVSSSPLKSWVANSMTWWDRHVEHLPEHHRSSMEQSHQKGTSKEPEQRETIIAAAPCWITAASDCKWVSDWHIHIRADEKLAVGIRHLMESWASGHWSCTVHVHLNSLLCWSLQRFLTKLCSSLSCNWYILFLGVKACSLDYEVQNNSYLQTVTAILPHHYSHICSLRTSWGLLHFLTQLPVSV